jgi:peptidyl-prolyl cis-trans isomerase A (cyclophilin A)
MNKLIIAFILLFFVSCNHPHNKNPHVLINTRLGDIELELFPDKAPKTVAAFLSYVDSGFYKNSSFYRVLKADDMPTDFNTGIIQGGIYQSDNHKIGKVQPIPHESTKQTGLSHISGTVSFASMGAGTATTEFFICIGDQLTLDAGASGTSDGQGYAAFGKVFKGMSIVRKIQNQNSHGDRLDEKVDILSIERL